MQAFRDTMQFCDLHDLGFNGLPWTYNNKQVGRKNVRVRLDRAMANQGWCNLYQDICVQHIMSSRSDHLPIILRSKKFEQKINPKRWPKYEYMWEREESLLNEVADTWSKCKKATDLADIKNNLQTTMDSLRTWSKAKFGGVDREITKLKKRLERLYSTNLHANNDEIQHVMARLDELLLREEMLWKQRSRVQWIKVGEQNTKFFHRKASWRAKKNKISVLKTSDNILLQDRE